MQGAPAPALGLEVTITPASAYTQNPLDDSGFEMRRIAADEGTHLIKALPARLPLYALCDNRHYRWQVGERRYLSEGSMALLARTQCRLAKSGHVHDHEGFGLPWLAV